MDRYEEYYNAYDENSGTNQTALASVIAKNFLDENEPIMDVRVTMFLATDIPLLVKALEESIFDHIRIA